MGLIIQIKILLNTSVQSLGILLILCTSINSASDSASEYTIDPLLQVEYCKNFTHGDTEAKEFYSPGFPKNYPAGIKCFRTISADYGYFVRLDFRDYFHIEPPSNDGECKYDFLEIRDGDQGYSTLIDHYCGSNFPPIITSSGRSLWLRFKSDGTIEYRGFKAVYNFIPNPLETLPFIPKCEFEIGGSMGFIGSANISEEHMNYANKYGEPIDCTWIIRAEQEKKIYLQFPKYELEEPNDCNFNSIQIFDEKTDREHRLHNFCGSVPENFVSKTDVLYIRYFAAGNGIGSEFVAVFTELLKIEDTDECPEKTYDCDDTYCIDDNLVCNSVRNCRFGWDEESCADGGSEIALDITAPHVIIIMLLLFLIMTGMCAGMIYNLHRKLTEDKEDILASREKSLASLASAISLDEVASNSKPRGSKVNEDLNGCYVPPPPDGGYPFATKN